jgi:hypothetical protein
MHRKRSSRQTDIKIVNTFHDGLVYRPNENENLRSWSTNLFTHDQYVGDKLDYAAYIPKQKADGRLKISWTSLKIQNLQLAKMDRPFILSNQ